MQNNGRLDTDSLIESVVRITGQRDRATLESCLVTTLQTLLGAHRVTLVRVVVRNENWYAEVLASVTTGASLFEGGPIPVFGNPLLTHLVGLGGPADLPYAGTGMAVTACPFATEQRTSEGWLIVEGDQPFTTQHALIGGMAAIYGNYLSIIDATENDTLTGLRNRKTFDDRVGRILTAAQGGAPAESAFERRHADASASHWLGVLDIDHFKRVNDTFGHVFGDEVLLLFAQLMRTTFRTDDLLFRYGGEEFVVVLAPIAAEGAMDAFERFRRAVEAYDFPQVGQVTASIGVVRIGEQFVPSEVVGHADEALYHAKRHGRNRVCLYETLVAEGHLSQSHSEGDVELF